MPLYESESLVLKSYNLAEADRIVVFFTREHGIVRGVAKGAKRLKSKFGSTLELFSTVHLTYFQKEDRELVSIQEVELVRSCFAEASDPDFLSTFSYIADLLTAFAPPHDPDETLYRMTQACLATDAIHPQRLGAVVLYFELWLLRLGGYLPDWSKCDLCKRLFTMDEISTLQSSSHLCCEACRRTNRTEIISGPDRDIFNRVQKLSPTEFVNFASDKAASVAEVSAAMKRIISQVLGHDSTVLRAQAVNY